MFNRNGRRVAQRRRLTVIAGTAMAVSAFAFSAAAESPALAGEHAPIAAFDHAFAPFELTEAEMTPNSATVDAAQARFDAAPVEKPEETRVIGSGRASYYGKRFAGRRTANGERFNPSALTAAHRTLPFGTRLKVTNPSNGRSVVVRINDRGPFHGGRVIDLSREAARQIGLIQQGHGVVQLAAIAS